MTTKPASELTRAQLRQSAALTVSGGRNAEYTASLMVGAPGEREQARQAAMSAFEVWLDTLAEQTWFQLKELGIDPEKEAPAMKLSDTAAVILFMACAVLMIGISVWAKAAVWQECRKTHSFLYCRHMVNQ